MSIFISNINENCMTQFTVVSFLKYTLALLLGLVYLPPILSVIPLVTIDTMQKNNGLKNVTCKQGFIRNFKDFPDTLSYLSANSYILLGDPSGFWFVPRQGWWRAQEAIPIQLLGESVIYINFCLSNVDVKYMTNEKDILHITSFHRTCRTLLFIRLDFNTSGGSRIFPRGVPTYDFAKFSQKLHEIERIWIRGARPSGPP